MLFLYWQSCPGLAKECLETGDSLMFDSSLEHTYFNNQESLLKLMVINYYPN